MPKKPFRASSAWSQVSCKLISSTHSQCLHPVRYPCADFEKANEIYFRLGIIYKQQHKYPASLDCFRYILGHPPRPLTEVDIWFQIGHVYEQQKDVSRTRLSRPLIRPTDLCFPLCSTALPRTLTSGSSRIALIMPRFCSNSAGCIIRAARALPTKILPSPTSQRVSKLVSRTLTGRRP